MSPVDRLYREAADVLQKLNDASETSLAVSAMDNFRKSLLLAVASHFEYRVSAAVLEFVSECTPATQTITSLVKQKAITRQYHTWFKWETKNANTFFALFGERFKADMEQRVKQSDELRIAIQAFLEIGNDRNLLIHQDYATFALNKTLEEIYVAYQTATRFVEFIPGALREHVVESPPANPAME